MTLNISKALKVFDLAEFADLNCGEFDIRIRQAAVHNEGFRAAVAKRSMAAKRKSLVPDKGSLTGNFEQDVELFCEMIVVGWGKRALTDDDGNEVAWSRDVGYEMFTSTQEGKVLFGKVMQNAVSDEVFAITEADTKNS
jgi:hypothetical protein